jgi:hypothetical protein
MLNFYLTLNSSVNLFYPKCFQLEKSFCHCGRIQMKNVQCNTLGSVKTYLLLSLSSLLSELLECDYKLLFVKFSLLNHITIYVIYIPTILVSICTFPTNVRCIFHSCIAGSCIILLMSSPLLQPTLESK